MLVTMYWRIFCRNIVRDEEAAKLCDELKAMRDLHEQQKEVAILISYRVFFLIFVHCANAERHT